MTFEILKFACMAMGCVLLVISCFGVYRLPDVYCRSHALAKSLPLAVNLILIALWMHVGTDHVGFKTFLAILFQVISIPVAGHLIAWIAFQKDVPRWHEREVTPPNK